MTTYGDIKLGNGLLPDDTKPLTEPMLTHQKYAPMTFISGRFHLTKINMKINDLKFRQNLPGANAPTRTKTGG